MQKKLANSTFVYRDKNGPVRVMAGSVVNVYAEDVERLTNAKIVEDLPQGAEKLEPGRLVPARYFTGRTLPQGTRRKNTDDVEQEAAAAATESVTGAPAAAPGAEQDKE